MQPIHLAHIVKRKRTLLPRRVLVAQFAKDMLEALAVAPALAHVLARQAVVRAPKRGLVAPWTEEFGRGACAEVGGFAVGCAFGW